MVNNKRRTDACIMCDHEGCQNCNFNPAYRNQFKPNEQTAAMLSDLLIPEDVLLQIQWQTLEDRCRRG